MASSPSLSESELLKAPAYRATQTALREIQPQRSPMLLVLDDSSTTGAPDQEKKAADEVLKPDVDQPTPTDKKPVPESKESTPGAVFNPNQLLLPGKENGADSGVVMPLNPLAPPPHPNQSPPPGVQSGFGSNPDTAVPTSPAENGQAATDAQSATFQSSFPLGLNPTIIQALRFAQPAIVGGGIPGSGGRWYEAPVANDPVVRAAAFSPVSLPQTFLDGVGGIPAPLATRLLGAQVPPGARVFRLGPLTASGAFSLSGNYSHSSGGASSRAFTDFANSSPQPIATPKQSRGGNTTLDEFGGNVGGNFNFVLGEPETGHFMSISYGFALDEQTPNQNSGQPFTQSLSALGRLSFGKVTLGLGVSFDQLSGMDRDIGGDADRSLFGISLNASCPLGAKTSLDWDISIPIRRVAGGINSTDFTSSQTFNYAFDPKFSLGLGYSLGMESDRADSGFDRTASKISNANRTEHFVNVFTRASFRPTPKLSFSGDLGAELRDDGGKESWDPLIDFDVFWMPRPTTTVLLTIQETVQGSSVMAQEDQVSTSFQISLQQQLGPRLNGVLTFGYEHADYKSSSMSASALGSRVDNLFSAQVGLSFALSNRWTASLFYSYGNNLSSEEAFQFTSSQMELQTSIAF